ncbi:MAG: hypothetical protein O2800_04235 [Planctomycetota bacterium]|nr:hypothetical protein [Planctomycetota bacterium]
MSRRPRVTLYEALRQPEGVADGSSGGSSRPSGSGPDSIASIGFGTVIAILGIAITLVGGAYFIGFTHGRGTAQQDQSSRAVAVVDPIARTSPAAAGSSQVAPPLPPPSRNTPQTVAEPRVSGLNYIVIASVEPERVAGIISFLTSKGLDAHATRWDTGRLLQIFVLPGYAKGESASATVRALEKKIDDVGRQWKATAQGNEDFRSRYARKYVGP